jgi:hypothetical protein
MNSGNPEKTEHKSKILNISVAVAAAQVGCVTLVVVLAAIFLGMWLDSQFQTKPIFTLVFVLGSIPVSVISMLLIVRAAVKRIKIKNEQQ